MLQPRQAFVAFTRRPSEDDVRPLGGSIHADSIRAPRISAKNARVIQDAASRQKRNDSVPITCPRSA
jgi:hypothetical protein